MADDDDHANDKPSALKRVAAFGGLVVSAVYLANIPLVPELPDLLPIVGNLDELLASALFLWSTRTLGIRPIRLLLGDKKKEQKRLSAAPGAREG